MDKKILTALINILWIDKDWEPYTGEMYVGIVSGKYAYVTNPRSLSPYQLLKIPVDTILFLLSFQIQREWVFRQPKKDP